MRNALSDLGFTETFRRSVNEIVELTAAHLVGRVRRIDRGLTTILCVKLQDLAEASTTAERRVRMIDADVAVGDWVVADPEGERLTAVVPRRTRLVRRASSDDDRAQAHVIAANVDVIFLVHSLDTTPNQRRLERELVIAFDSGAQPVVVLTKSDVIDAEDVRAARRVVAETSLGVPVVVVSSLSGEGLSELRTFIPAGATAVVLGASGVGKSTLVNALTGSDSQETGEIRRGDKKGRHTTTAAELVPLPEHGWLIDTPGLRTVGLWTSGHGIERAFADVFALSEHCKFRDCKHTNEPGCAVQSAIATGHLDPRRLESMQRLVAEEADLESKQRRTKR